MLSIVNLRQVVIGPALEVFPPRMSTLATELLLIGTALAEIGLVYLRQGKRRLDGARGEALGLRKRNPGPTTIYGPTSYASRAGIEGTLSQGIRAYGLRHARFIGEAKTHLQHVLTAAAIDFVRIGNWLMKKPLAKTRTSTF
jgi:hypothetical protein